MHANVQWKWKFLNASGDLKYFTKGAAQTIVTTV